jgi:hypothetical protein
VVVEVFNKLIFYNKNLYKNKLFFKKSTLNHIQDFIKIK